MCNSLNTVLTTLLTHQSRYVPTLIILLLIGAMWMIPDYFVNPVYQQHNSRESVQILSTDNSLIHRAGLIAYGEQLCQVEILSGPYRGTITTGVNMLAGKLETDKLFIVGDRALALITAATAETAPSVTLIDHYRLHLELFLLLAFACLLILVAGWVGVRAIVSFVFSVLAIWKVLIPAILLGYSPIWVGFGVTFSLIVVIILLVYGFNRCFLSAVLGSLLGTLITALMANYFVVQFTIHGAVMNFAESLLYSGYATINLTQIFIASIFIASSGAVMDVAVDITSAVNEVIAKKPEIKPWEAVLSGMNVGRAVIGTMTTTLLLAYSGGYLALLMVFVAQGTPVITILNLNYVSAEILHTIIGSFGLITVVPFTALTSGWLLTARTP